MGMVGQQQVTNNRQQRHRPLAVLLQQTAGGQVSQGVRYIHKGIFWGRAAENGQPLQQSALARRKRQPQPGKQGLKHGRTGQTVQHGRQGSLFLLAQSGAQPCHSRIAIGVGVQPFCLFWPADNAALLQQLLALRQRQPGQRYMFVCQHIHPLPHQ